MAFTRSEVILGYGKHIAYADSAGGSYTNVDGTQDIQLPERELGESEITNDDSGDYHRDFIPALYDAGVVTFTYVYTKSQFAALDTIFQLGTTANGRGLGTGGCQKYWKVTLPDGSTAKFTGYLRKHDLPTTIDESPVVNVEIRVNSKMTYSSSGS